MLWPPCPWELIASITGGKGGGGGGEVVNGVSMSVGHLSLGQWCEHGSDAQGQLTILLWLIKLQYNFLLHVSMVIELFSVLRYHDSH